MSLTEQAAGGNMPSGQVEQVEQLSVASKRVERVVTPSFQVERLFQVSWLQKSLLSRFLL